MGLTRRQILAGAVLGIAAGARKLPGVESAPGVRKYHACLSVEAIEAHPELLDVVARAGVGTVWVAGFFYGHWPFALEAIERSCGRIAAKGLETGVVNVPLGHPGDSLGSRDGSFPLTPPRTWRPGVRPDGSTYAGTSLHEPATAANVEALTRLHRRGATRFFVDDDFRLATGPGVVGGCFCAEHRRKFLEHGGHAPGQWEELLEDIRRRSLTPLLRDWVDFTCDELTASFRSQAKAAGGAEALGIMVMYLGAEKAGIRLADYARIPMRVGELMFGDESFGPVKGKTDELFSALFHRRFVAPERAFSETTTYPAGALSARNLAAKLAVSTLADVRNTMFMSGLSPFSNSHWEVLHPAMQRNAEIHERVAGHRPRGPLKHLWGEASRYVGDDRPFSLPLALGIPFEVTESPAKDGWTFLSDADAAAAGAGHLKTEGTAFLGRASAGTAVRGIEEELGSLRAWKASAPVAAALAQVPHVDGEGAAILAWYPSARSAVVWNLEERRREVVIRDGEARRAVVVEGLGIALVEGILAP
jgi:hypothetical protein